MSALWSNDQSQRQHDTRFMRVKSELSERRLAFFRFCSDSSNEITDERVSLTLSVRGEVVLAMMWVSRRGDIMRSMLGW